ncbi:MAG: ArnT family glycosyltransferase [Desulfobulbaceae bacterium]
MLRLDKTEGALLLSFLTPFSFSLLYIFRAFDNNTLTSWQWVFSGGGFGTILLYLVATTLAAPLISSLPLENHPLPVLAALAALSIVPLWSGPELLLDSGRYFLQAKALSHHGAGYFFQEWGQAITAWTDLPLVPFLYGLILKYGQESRTAVQLFNTLIFSLTVILTSLIGTRLWNRELGFHAGLLLTGIPYLLTQVPQLLVDIHAMFYLVLAVYCFLWAITSTGYLSLFVSALTLMLASLVKFSTWPMLAILPLCSLVVDSGPWKIRLRRILIILLPAALLLFVIAASKSAVLARQLELLFAYQRPALLLWDESLFSTFFFQGHPFIPVLAVLALYRAWRRRDRRFLFILSFCLLLFILRIERSRYTIPLLPYITLAAAYGLAAFREIWLRRLAGCLIVSWSLVILYGCYLPFFATTSMMNLKRAGASLDKMGGSSVEVVVLLQEKSAGSTFAAIPLLDLFTEKKIISRQKWPGREPAQLSPHSPLLFTWQLDRPDFYQLPGEQVPLPPLVIIGPGPADNDYYRYFRPAAVPPDPVIFSGHSGRFLFRTFVAIYP